MRTAQKLLLLVVAAIAAMALSATAANATSAVEVSAEPGGTHCGEVTVTDHDASGGCLIHATSTGTANLFAHVGTSEVLFSACNNEFDARINEEGSGFIYNQVLTGGSCGLAPCDEAAPDHDNLVWPLKSAELFPDHEVLGVLFCVRSIASEEGENNPPCGVVIDVVEVTPNAHDYAFQANGVPCLEAPQTELHGNWTLEDTNIEIDHL